MRAFCLGHQKVACAAILAMAIFSFINVKAAVPPNSTNYQKTYKKQKNRYLKIEKKQRALLAALYKIDRRLKITRKKAAKNEEDYYSSQANSKKLLQVIKKLQDDIKVQERSFRSRLAQVYKMKGRESLLKVIFSAETPSELKRMMEYTRRINAKDAEQIQKLKVKKDKLDLQQTKLAKLLESIRSREEVIARQEKELEVELKKKNKIIKALRYQSKRQLKRMVRIKKANPQWKELKLSLSNDFFESKGELEHPINATISKGYGFIEDPEFGYKLTHKGYLYKANKKQNVNSVYQGKVAFVGRVPGYGKTVILDHGNHYYSVYAHLSKSKVKAGEAVKRNTQVGSISGKGTKKYLYFELRHFSEAINPMNWIRKDLKLATAKEVKSEKLLSKK